MGLSRLEAFLKSVRGNLIHVDPNALDSTDSIENDGSSQMVPFKTINRALAEAARFSYQSGLDNDRFGRTTILVYPGQHIVDNRPGVVIDDVGNTILRSSGSTTIQQWSLNSIYDLTASNNDLFKLNSVHGGLILPRGVSLVAKDPRKTIIRPLYVPDPENDNIERSSIFRVTGASFFFGFTILDADPNATIYKDYTTIKVTPNFSHHKLTCFEYADGVNNVVISDDFNQITTTRTDLEMFYEKISLVYGASSGRPIPSVDYFDGVDVDIQPVIDEYRIVGSRGKEFSISSIQAGNGVTASPTITVTLSENIEGISVDTPIEISGVGVEGYDGQFVVRRVLDANTIQYRTNIIPTDAAPTIFGAGLNIVVDTVSSASPYIFNVSLRSVYGMCGLHADGSKADGFKSMVVAQFTGIGVQKDDNAFVLYDDAIGAYTDATSVSGLYKNSRARFKPQYENYHIKVSEGAFCQLVSIFAIGFANQFLAESGGDYSITNSNSNFGAKALVSSGFNRDSFPRDDVGYITEIIPPKDLDQNEITIEFSLIDINLTVNVVANDERLYLYGETNSSEKPQVILDGYRIGAAQNEILYLKGSEASVVMPGTTISGEKSFGVAKSLANSALNDISASGVITLSETHSFTTGEKVRVVSDNGHLPDGLTEKIYYVIVVNSPSNNQIGLSDTYDSALNDIFLDINSNGGNLRVVSRVSDKDAGEFGHPVQWDSGNSNWYISVLPGSTMYQYLLTKSSVPVTNRTYIKRTPDRRRPDDTIYKFKYVIPNGSSILARPPVDGYIIQNSNRTVLGENEFDAYFNGGDLEFVSDLRNPQYISNATWQNSLVEITCELDHKLKVGSTVKISNVIPEGYNGTYTVSEIISSKRFRYSLETDPGTFQNPTFIRDGSLPYFENKETNITFKLYRIDEIQEYIPEKQDGIYELVIINNSVSPIVEPFNQFSFSQPVKNLYPQVDRDNPISTPEKSVSFALSDNIGEVTINDPRNSITRETLEKTLVDLNIGFGITSIISSTGTAHTIYTEIDHGLSAITSLSIVNTGSNYIPGTYYGVDLVGGGGSHEKAVITIDNTGILESIQIMDGGSGYSVNQDLSVIPAAGIGTTTGFVPATVRVSSVSNNVDDIISISGFDSEYSQYNTLYRVTGVPGTKSITVSSVDSITNFSQTLVNESSVGTIIGRSLTISGFTYSATTGNATVTTSTNHGFKVGQKIRLTGFTSAFYNKEATISSINSVTVFVINLGITSPAPSTAGSRRVFPVSYEISRAGSNRGVKIYGGITGSLGALVNSNDGDNVAITITNAVTLGLKIGDFLEIDDEIVRIRSQVTSNQVFVFRAQLGTVRENHLVNTVVRKLNPIPVEFRRNSIIRASGHTFEYVGFGPGNYSTAFPERQDRKLSASEKFLSQATQYNGGVVYYSGTDDSGDFYSGNKKTSSATGKEEVFDTPLITFTGEEDATSEVVSTNDIFVGRSIRVDGGKNSNVVSEFNGPVILNKKLTSYSSEGIEAPSFFIQGDQEISRKYSISTDQPTYAANYGDIIYRASPNEGENIGWVYTTSDRWRTWGYVGDLGTLVYIYSGTENGPSTLEGIVDKLKFVGDPNGFGIDVDIQIDPTVGFGTILLRNPIDIINFGNNVLGSGAPSFTTRSAGSRLVYQNSLTDTQTDYATGVRVPNGALWNSVPQFNDNFKFEWYGGVNLIATLTGTGNLTISGDLTATNIIGNVEGDVTGNVTGNASSADQVKTITRGNNTNPHYITFVDSNNATATNEIVYTDAGITYNPSTNILTTNLDGNATSSDLVKTVSTATNANHFLTFVNSNNNTSSNETVYTDAGITYNPSTNILTVDGTINASIINGNLSGTASIATTALNLQRSVIAGNGLTGGGSLEGQDVTLDVVAANNGGITVNADSIEVDSSVVRTSGAQEIDGVKNFEGRILVSNRTTGNQISLTLNDGLGNANIAFNHTEGIPSRTGNSGRISVNTDNNTSAYMAFYLESGVTAGQLVPLVNTERFRITESQIQTSGDIVAFVSDIRLKANIEPIDNALNKVLSLSGFTYNFNELAQEKGFDGSVRHSGVSAQEVQKVLPEAVRPAPADDNYMTVQYEKLVPLLIEAIKEQNQKIESLEKRIQELGG